MTDTAKEKKPTGKEDRDLISSLAGDDPLVRVIAIIILMALTGSGSGFLTAQATLAELQVENRELQRRVYQIEKSDPSVTLARVEEQLKAIDKRTARIEAILSGPHQSPPTISAPRQD